MVKAILNERNESKNLVAANSTYTTYLFNRGAGIESTYFI